jgi:hypothetical protein
MAAVGRPPAGERDKPPISDVITASGDGADQDKPIANVITSSKPTGPDAPGSSMPQVANTITKAGPNK